MAESIKVNIVSAKAFVNLAHGGLESLTWGTLVRPVVRLLGKMVFKPSMHSCATSIKMYSMTNQSYLYVDNKMMLLI